MDRIKEDFLKQMLAFMEKAYEKSSIELQQQFDKQLPEIVNSLQVCIMRGLKQLNTPKGKVDISSLFWIDISYVRNGVLSNNDCFRIDCYDSKNCIPSVESTRSWKFPFVWLAYRDICCELEEMFEQQTIMGKLEFDLIRLGLADNYYSLVRNFIHLIIKRWLDEYGTELLDGKNIPFITGECLDWSEFILLWNQKTTRKE